MKGSLALFTKMPAGSSFGSCQTIEFILMEVNLSGILRPSFFYKSTLQNVQLKLLAPISPRWGELRLKYTLDHLIRWLSKSNNSEKRRMISVVLIFRSQFACFFCIQILRRPISKPANHDAISSQLQSPSPECSNPLQERRISRKAKSTHEVQFRKRSRRFLWKSFPVIDSGVEDFIIVALMDESSITVSEKDGMAYIRVSGRGSFKNARYVKSFAEKMMELGIYQFVFDMQDCSHMDSTFMGILAALATGLKRSKHPFPSLVNLSPRNLELLQNLGLDRVLTIAEGQTILKAAPFSAIAETNEPEKEQIAQTMLKAHQALVEVDPRNALKFEDVISYLNQKLGVRDT